MNNRQRVFLLEHATGVLVEGLLVTPVTHKHVDDWRTTWRPYQENVVTEFEKSGIPVNEWHQHSHWSWEKKLETLGALLAYQGFAVEYGDVTQGMMFVNLTKSGMLKVHEGKPIVYVSFLEAAPWNRAIVGQTPRLRLVGSVLMGAAVQLSFDQGFQGRVGLHSLRQADPFYRDKCGMTEVCLDPDHHDLRYFEMTAVQAEVFASKGKKL